MHPVTSGAAIRRVALLGNHLPRLCGITTFTTHLRDAIKAEFPTLDCAVLAINDAGSTTPIPRASVS